MSMVRLIICGAITAALVATPVMGRQASDGAAATGRVDAATAALVERAYDAAFNLDHDEAIALARQAVSRAPGAAASRRALASVLWMKILFVRGSVTVDHFMSGMSAAQKHLPEPPAALDDELRAELARSLELAEARVEAEPASVDARYDVGAAYALRASYTASIEGSLRAAFQSARHAFNAQEAVLEADPGHPSANVVVGTYRYLVSSLGLATRWLAYVAGFGGGKERGIGMIEQALESGGEATVEAGTALLLIYSREGRHADAYGVASRLADRYPRNRLFVLEAGAAAVRAGLAGHAETVLTRGLGRLDRDPRPKVPGERAVWLHQRGLARLQQNRRDAAEADFRAALSNGATGWLRGRVHMALGKLHDLAGRRADAQAAYRQARGICEALDDTVCEDEVKALQQRPFSMDGGGLLE
jgi:tetratricopeptide (TPR) repeat protein